MKKQSKKTVSAKINTLTSKADVRGRTLDSIIEILRTGKTRTGSSGYSKGWARKDVWTNQVINACKTLGIYVVSGNDAPRGGANGEYVMLVADRRKNQLVHKYHAILARYTKIDAARRDRIYLENCAKSAAIRAEIEIEFELLKPFLLDHTTQIIDSNKLMGEEKSKTQAALLKAILQKAGIEKLQHFWDVWKKINGYAHDIHFEKVKSESELKRQQCLKTGETFVTKEMFHVKTRACYHGINAFLRQKFGSDAVVGLPLSEVMNIVPEEYLQRLLS